MDSPSKCDDEDRLVLHVLARSGGYPELAEWVSQGWLARRPSKILTRRCVTLWAASVWLIRRSQS